MADLPDSIRRFTGLARTVDVDDASNRFALFAAAVVFVIATAVGLISGTGLGDVLPGALRSALAVFLAWAIARELDPDRTRTARYAAFGGGALLLAGAPDLAALFAVLLGVRVVTRSTGVRPTTWDLLGIAVVAGLAGNDPTGVVAAFGLAGALVWDTRLPLRSPREVGLAGGGVGVVALGSAIVGGALLAGWDAPGIVAIVVFLLALAAATQLREPTVRARADATDEVLHEDRIRAARMLAGGVLVGTMIWVGGPSVPALGGAWAAFIATGAVSWQVSRTVAATAMLALLLGACASEEPPVASAPSPTPTATTAPLGPSPRPSPSPSPTPPPPPEVRSHEDPTAVATDLVAAELAIRDPDTPPAHVEGWAHVQQAAYRELAERSGWTEQVRPLVPEQLRGAFDLNAEAQAQLHALTKPKDSLPDWTIVPPPPADELLDAYRTAAAEFGVDWTYLAAIHLTETRMGRIHGDSSAGARGPMQFMPATWEAYGEGDITDPTDAIRAAARYLVAHGAPQDMHRALYAYNHSDRYVTAVRNYAQVMQAEPETYRAYHAWRVYYRLTSGSVVLDVGWTNAG